MTTVVVHALEYPNYRADAYRLEAEGYKFEEHTFPNVYDVPDVNVPDVRNRYPGFYCVVVFDGQIREEKLYSDGVDEYRYLPDAGYWSCDGSTPAHLVVSGLYMRACGVDGDPTK